MNERICGPSGTCIGHRAQEYAIRSNAGVDRMVSFFVASMFNIRSIWLAFFCCCYAQLGPSWTCIGQRAQGYAIRSNAGVDRMVSILARCPIFARFGLRCFVVATLSSGQVGRVLDTEHKNMPFAPTRVWIVWFPLAVGVQYSLNLVRVASLLLRSARAKLDVYLTLSTRICHSLQRWCGSYGFHLVLNV